MFAYALGYNNTDYSPIGAASQLQTPIQTGKGLYNGNIATMSSKTQVIDNNNPWVQQYTYDQLNRIKTSTTQGTNQYATSYSYDANGNILNLTRKNNAGGDIDNLTYNYEKKSSGYQRNTNRLRSVDDAVATTAQTDDIEDQQEDNYRYDATGNLIYDRSEEIERIEWTVSGKVLKVIRTTTSTKPNLEFTYDASGNRIAKKVIEKNGDYKTTFYVRDASGNVMAVYKTSGTTNLSLEEQHIYGSSRLGIFKKDKTIKNKARALGERRYELTDHLGNVRVVMSDYKRTAVIVLSATDYYPFGMVARTYTSPEEYRYGFNGQEKVEEISGNGNHTTAEHWEYDTRLGRRWNIDPVVMAWESGYATFRNNPIMLNDVNGDCPDCPDGNYTVQKGDTYWDLEEKWGLDHGTLEQLNPGVDPTKLKVGQSIVANTDIPVNGPSTTTTTTTSVSYETQYIEQEVQRSYAAPIGIAVTTSVADGPLPFGEVIGGVVIGGFFLYDMLAPPSTITTPIVIPITTTTTHEQPSQFNYVTYTKTNPATGFVYVGRTSGYGSPQQIVNARDVNHHMTAAGYGKAMVSTSLPATIPGGYASRALDPSYWAIRGSEQMQIEAYRKLGISGNAINGIGPSNPNRSKYMQEALKMLSKMRDF